MPFVSSSNLRALQSAHTLSGFSKTCTGTTSVHPRATPSDLGILRTSVGLPEVPLRPLPLPLPRISPLSWLDSPKLSLTCDRDEFGLRRGPNTATSGGIVSLLFIKIIIITLNVEFLELQDVLLRAFVFLGVQENVEPQGQDEAHFPLTTTDNTQQSLLLEFVFLVLQSSSFRFS
jgi:hypothetical protein